MGRPSYNLRKNVAAPTKYGSEDPSEEAFATTLFRSRSYFQNPKENKKWHPQDPMSHVEYNPDLPPACFPSIGSDEAARRYLTQSPNSSIEAASHVSSLIQNSSSANNPFTPPPTPSISNDDQHDQHLATNSTTQQTVSQNRRFGSPEFLMGREPEVDTNYSNCDENCTYKDNVNTLIKDKKKEQEEDQLVFDDMASSDEEIMRYYKEPKRFVTWKDLHPALQLEIMWNMRNILDSDNLAADRLGLTYPEREELLMHDACFWSLQESDKERGLSWLAQYRDYLRTHPSTRLGQSRQRSHFPAVFQAHFERVRDIGVDFYHIVTTSDRAKANVFLKSKGFQVPEAYRHIGPERVDWSAKILEAPKNPTAGPITEAKATQAISDIGKNTHHEPKDQTIPSPHETPPLCPDGSDPFLESPISSQHATAQSEDLLRCSMPEYVRVPKPSARGRGRPPKIDFLKAPPKSTAPVANLNSLSEQPSLFRLLPPKKPTAESQQFSAPTEKRITRNTHRNPGPNTNDEAERERSLLDQKKQGEVRMYNNVRRISSGLDTAQNGRAEATPESNPSTGRSLRSQEAMRLPDKYAGHDVTPIAQAGRSGNVRADRGREKSDENLAGLRRVSFASTAVTELGTTTAIDQSPPEPSAMILGVPLLKLTPRRRSKGAVNSPEVRNGGQASLAATSTDIEYLARRQG
ncbi:MAG: hypothetical protein MMC33_001713 [Icmadophila ericetorum]|nr:hypothetical protein [Icmadophila ericetorum]